ncbi:MULTISPECIES: hypothetical protein [Sphingobacterium]|uniref:Uncharacterized protein n=1 Tax=Sphingobacterium populi TaxID=1812824 RepID=A0ABW5UEJ9_9SPHI|nr:hypothetical protein [Sphingobacterium sp. CFCC 11742]
MGRLVRKTYISPHISTIYVEIESAFAAGSVVTITVEDSNPPNVLDWEERESEQIWNF